MKGKSSILSSVLIMALGVVLIIINKRLQSSGVVMCGGILFLLASVLNIFVLLSEDRNHRVSMISQAFGWICSIAGGILGICMLVFDSVFVPLIPYIFGALLVLASFFHYYVLAISYRPVMFPAWMYILPTLILIAGVWVFFLSPGVEDSVMMIVTGCGLVVFSLTVFIEAGFIHGYNKRLRREERPVPTQPSAPAPQQSAVQPKEDKAEIKDLDNAD